MVYLLDTNHCSRIINGDTTLIDRLQQNANVGVSTSVIVRGELIFMAQNSQQRASNLQRVQAFLTAIDLYPINKSIGDRYGELKAKLYEQFAPKKRDQRRRTKIQDLGFDDNDLWIAATALAYNLTVVSADSDFSRIQQVQPLQLETWFSP
ncbi:type II toxin-antitoxin system VapC family toxin [Oscillatoria sp. CS-180]|uniref:type II toxin-antitoxin system VapC family toxin n=1 Tax=Oscillatoria sp. CS-180 TaxID=3021720 RepID=UPI00232C78B4|nr:type II toxin-antitoxin system VapC family toxin [Oscillatoria sp. CS-180]MDB9528573.1 type II toxin-antitoxin system VapC family toxin [Oscillatoria sp. CS-180]